MRALIIIKFLLLLPVWPLCFIGYRKNKEAIDADLNRLGGEGYRFLIAILLQNTAFRNLFYYRIGKMGKLIGLFLRKHQSLHICSTSAIGKGLVIAHGDNTFINPQSIGENCYVNQNVTIGVVGDKKPTIGNNVRIATGAIVIGGITIGDNATIAAGAVVVKNVPANCLIVGNPAIIKKINGERVNIPL